MEYIKMSKKKMSETRIKEIKRHWGCSFPHKGFLVDECIEEIERLQKVKNNNTIKFNRILNICSGLTEPEEGESAEDALVKIEKIIKGNKK
jgi:hypothetical protein